MNDITLVNFRLDRAAREGLARIAEARGLQIDRSAFKGEPDRTAALRQLIAEELARMDSISLPAPAKP